MLLSVLFEIVPLGVRHLADVAPLLGLIAVYYWSIYRPQLIPAPFVFAVGLVHDLLSGGPLGLMALVLVALHIFCVSQRRVLIGRSFGVGWFGFMLVAPGAALLEWIVASIYFMHPMDPVPLLVQLVLTIVLYPPLNWLFNRVELAVARAA